MYRYVCICMHVYTYIHTYIHTYIQMCIYASTYTSTSTYTYTYTYAYTYTYTCTYTYTFPTSRPFFMTAIYYRLYPGRKMIETQFIIIGFYWVVPMYIATPPVGVRSISHQANGCSLPGELATDKPRSFF